MNLLDIPGAIGILRRGGVIIVPSDSCFGLAGNAMNEEVFKRVLSLKGRGAERPPALFVPDLKDCDTLVSLSDILKKQIASLIPGPVTLLFRQRPGTPSWLCDPSGRIGIRMIHHKPLIDVLRQSGLILTATSANRTGEDPPYSSEDLRTSPLLTKVDGILGGSCGGLQPSTVIDLSGDRPILLREGPIDFNEVLREMEGIQ